MCERIELIIVMLEMFFTCYILGYSVKWLYSKYFRDVVELALTGCVQASYKRTPFFFFFFPSGKGTRLSEGKLCKLWRISL